MFSVSRCRRFTPSSLNLGLVSHCVFLAFLFQLMPSLQHLQQSRALKFKAICCHDIHRVYMRPNLFVFPTFLFSLPAFCCRYLPGAGCLLSAPFGDESAAAWASTSSTEGMRCAAPAAGSAPHAMGREPGPEARCVCRGCLHRPRAYGCVLCLQLLCLAGGLGVFLALLALSLFPRLLLRCRRDRLRPACCPGLVWPGIFFPHWLTWIAASSVLRCTTCLLRRSFLLMRTVSRCALSS